MTLFHRRKLTIFGLALAVLSLHVHAVQQSLCSTQNSGSGYAAGKFTISIVGTNTDLYIVTDIYQSESACSATCTGYAYAVLQYQQCWCSNYTPSDTTDISKCNQNCPGWPYEQCGSATSRLYGYVALGQSPLGTIGASGTQISSNTEPTTSVILTSVVVVTSTQVVSTFFSLPDFYLYTMILAVYLIHLYDANLGLIVLNFLLRRFRSRLRCYLSRHLLQTR